MAILNDPDPPYTMLMTPDRRPWVIERGARPGWFDFGVGIITLASSVLAFERMYMRVLLRMPFHQPRRYQWSCRHLAELRHQKNMQALNTMVHRQEKEKLLAGMKTSRKGAKDANGR